MSIPREKRPKIIRYAEFPSAEYESKFKYCLSKVENTAQVLRSGQRITQFIRPKNIDKFEEVVKSNGLASCDTAMNIVRSLKAHPGTSIEFEVFAPSM